jgi:hypothetical protein
MLVFDSQLERCHWWAVVWALVYGVWSEPVPLEWELTVSQARRWPGGNVVLMGLMVACSFAKKPVPDLRSGDVPLFEGEHTELCGTLVFNNTDGAPSVSVFELTEIGRKEIPGRCVPGTVLGANPIVTMSQQWAVVLWCPATMECDGDYAGQLEEWQYWWGMGADPNSIPRKPTTE